jgi:hypothetical protein
LGPTVYISCIDEIAVSTESGVDHRDGFMVVNIASWGPKYFVAEIQPAETCPVYGVVLHLKHPSHPVAPGPSGGPASLVGRLYDTETESETADKEYTT